MSLSLLCILGEKINHGYSCNSVAENSFENIYLTADTKVVCINEKEAKAHFLFV